MVVFLTYEQVLFENLCPYHVTDNNRIWLWELSLLIRVASIYLKIKWQISERSQYAILLQSNNLLAFIIDKNMSSSV